MALDYLTFQRIITLLKEILENGRIVKISQVSNEEFLFIIRKENQNYDLLISTHPNMSYINILSNKIASNHINSNLLMIFRKYLDNGKIISFTQQNNDRIAKVIVQNKDDYFKNTIHKLYIELIGRASNIILTDENDIIIDSLKKIPLEYSNIRTIQPGIKYTLPDKPNEESLPYDLQNEINYLNCDYNEIKDKILESNDIYIVTKDNKSDFHFIPFTYLNGHIEKYQWNIGLEKYYENALSQERHRQFTSQLVKIAKNEIKRSEKKIKKLQEELQISKESTIYKYYGDLLLTYLQGQNIHTDKVEIFDEEKNTNVVIPYDIRYDLYHNANLYYKKYQKSKVAILKIQEQIDLCQDNIEYFNGILYQLDNANYLIATEIQEELTNLGYIKSKNNYKNHKNNSKKIKPKIYKPLTIKYKNIIIYVGQNNLQNEYLTFKIAKKTHMFFHIQQGAGSHVVVCSDVIDDNLKLFAANIAAYYSTYKMSSTVAVNYTLIKNIKKIPGGKPGKVIINNYKTIYVDPNYDLFKDYIV